MKILLVEDDLPTSELLMGTLLNHRYVVDVISDGAIALEMAVQWNYDLILLDLLLPGLSGFEVCRRLRAQACPTPVLMLTAKDSTEDIVAGLDAGADDYLVKTCDPAQLLARVRALLRRNGNASIAPVLTWERLVLDPASARVTYNQEPITLRPKEYALLELFLRHPQRIFSRSTIIDQLWSLEDTPVEGAITNLIKDLRQRLKAVGMQADLIETVYGLGYRLREAPELNETVNELKDVDQEHGRNFDPVLAIDREPDWKLCQERGKARIQQITERFHGSLTERIASLESAQRSLQAGQLSFMERQAAHVEAHKLAGGLGTFGCGKASELAREIEDLLEENLRQESHLTHQLTELLETLKQELTQSAVTR